MAMSFQLQYLNNYLNYLNNLMTLINNYMVNDLGFFLCSKLKIPKQYFLPCSEQKLYQLLQWKWS